MLPHQITEKKRERTSKTRSFPPHARVRPAQTHAATHGSYMSSSLIPSSKITLLGKHRQRNEDEHIPYLGYAKQSAFVTEKNRFFLHGSVQDGFVRIIDARAPLNARIYFVTGASYRFAIRRALWAIGCASLADTPSPLAYVRAAFQAACAHTARVLL